MQIAILEKRALNQQQQTKIHEQYLYAIVQQYKSVLIILSLPIIVCGLFSGKKNRTARFSKNLLRFGKIILVRYFKKQHFL